MQLGPLSDLLGLWRRPAVAQTVPTAAPAAAPLGFQADFVTISGTVTALLDEDRRGLPHQRFMLQEDEASGGLLLEVDADTKFGQRVPDLASGDTLTIRGKLYHDEPSRGRPAKDGIHWTHHRDVAGDAGFIRTADGRVYE